MSRQFLQRMLSPIAQIQEKEIFTTLLMFSYSFLAMAAYNAIKPVDRDDLFDLLAQRPDLLRQIFSALSRERAAKLAIASG